jgi:hypothetical protein
MSVQDWLAVAVVILLGLILWEIGQFRKDYRFINGLNRLAKD